MKNIEKVTKKAVRSFYPSTIKPAKPMHFRGEGAKYVGETEPLWPSVSDQAEWTRREYEKQLSSALNWYAGTQEDKTLVDAGLAALSLSGHFPELIVTIKNSTFPLPLTAAKLLRMAHCGFFLRFPERRAIVKAIKRCLDNQKKIVEKTNEDTNKPSIQDHLNARLRRVKGEIDQTFDQFIMDGYTYSGLKTKDTMNKKPLSLVATILNEPEFSVPVNRMSELAEYCQKYLDEYKAAFEERLPFAEAYSVLGKRKLKAAIDFWEQAIVDIGTTAHQKKSLHKTRVRKQKPPSQLVAKLKFLQEYKELKLKSIDPTQILKCSELWVYNTRLRKLGHYVSLNGMPFEIKSTRITNLDTNKSVQKTLRKPAEQLKELENYARPGAIKWFNNIKAVATPLREALNGDSILLKGVK